MGSITRAAVGFDQPILILEEVVLEVIRVSYADFSISVIEIASEAVAELAEELFTSCKNISSIVSLLLTRTLL